MEKIKISLKTPKNEQIEFREQVIDIVPFLSVEDQIALIKGYITDYFSQSDLMALERDVLMAEYGLMLGIVDRCTSIDVESLNINELLYNSDLYNRILEKILNYNSFRKILDMSLNAVLSERIEQMSIGRVVDGLYYKISSLLDDLANTTFDDTAIEKVTSMVEQINASPVMGEVIKKFSEKSVKPKGNSVKKKVAKK